MKNLDHYISSYNPDSLIRYLDFNGWSQIATLFGGRVFQYLSNDSKYDVLVPLDTNFSDFKRVLKNTLCVLSKYYNTQGDYIIGNILSPPSDIMKWRAGSNTGKVIFPFFDMFDFLESLKGVFASSINDVLTPQTYHSVLYTNEVKSILEKYAFGQTEIGSYIFNVLCPIGGMQTNLFNKPIERCVNEKILQSVNSIQNELSNGNRNKVDEDVDRGVYSVNFLESVLDMYDETKDIGLDLSVDWHKHISVDENIPKIIKLDAKYIDDVGCIAEKYKPKPVDEVKTYYGKISNIKSDPDLEKRKSVNITLVTIGDNEKKINVQVSLDYDLYFTKVQRAFEGGINVKIKGRISSTSRKRTACEASLDILD